MSTVADESGLFLELERLKVRNQYLEENNLRYVSMLDILLFSSDFQSNLKMSHEAAVIFKATFQQIRRLIPFKQMGFYVNTDDNDFEFSSCHPETSREEVVAEVETRIMDGSFAWAINQNRPILLSSPEDGRTVVLHVLTTQKRIRGMFVGLWEGDHAPIDAPALNCLSIILMNASYAHENSTLYAMHREYLHTLEEKVEQRTEELERARLMADGANRAKSAFLATMSHELRTPLNAIIGFTDIVLSKSEGPLTSEQEEYLGYVFKSSKHLLSLINDILDLSKVEAGKMELNMTGLNIVALMESSLVMVKGLAHQRGVKLTSTFAEALPATVYGDERKLKQIFYNLLFNAIKFTPDGGKINMEAVVTTKSLLPQRLQGAMKGEPNTPLLMVSIADSGVGLKNEDLERIFNPFEQADSTETREFEGTGLGLPLTRKLLELHDGVIWVESDGPGKGSVFRFVLPVRRRADV